MRLDLLLVFPLSLPSLLRAQLTVVTLHTKSDFTFMEALE